MTPLLQGLARLTLRLERIWPGIWPAAMVAGVFLSLALFDIWPHLNPWHHALVLGLFAIAFVIALVFGLRSMPPGPSDRDARRRLEQDSGLAHQPLETLKDELATDPKDITANVIWAAHQRRAAASAQKVRLHPPRSDLVRRDRLALRALVLLVLVVAGIVGRNDPGTRIVNALIPRVSAEGAAPPLTEVWITPPDYTAARPIYLSSATETPGAVPRFLEGSTVLARHAGAVEGVPLNLRVGPETVAMEALGGRGHEATVTARRGNGLALLRGNRELVSWPLVILPDDPPAVSFSGLPLEPEKGRLAIPFTLADEMTPQSVTLHLQVDDPLVAVLDGTESEARPISPPPRPADAEMGERLTLDSQVLADFTTHPWSGLSARLRLSAVDAGGQTGESTVIDITLPMREFNHPVAAELAALRLAVTLDDAEREAVADQLDELSRSLDRYGGDVTAFLGMRIARRRLLASDAPIEIASARRLMWETALHLEDGGLSNAGRRLEDALSRLEEALDAQAPDAEIEKLMAEVQAALNEYMQALRQMAEQGQLVEVPFSADMDMLDPQALRDIMQMMRDLSATGAREAARDLARSLREMIAGMNAQMQGPQIDPEMAREGAEIMRDLRALVERQQELMDQLFRDSGQPREGLPGDPQSREEMAGEQEALRRQLGDVMRRLDELAGMIPPQMGAAERAMDEARQALQSGDDPAALSAQGRALEALRGSMPQAGQGIAQALGMGQGQRGFGMMPMQPGGQRPGQDPLGRDMEDPNGSQSGRFINIPEKGEIQRTREILDELRRRAGEGERPPVERDYIDRLLDLF